VRIKAVMRPSPSNGPPFFVASEVSAGCRPSFLAFAYSSLKPAFMPHVPQNG